MQSEWFRFKPSKEILVVILSWVLVVTAFYLAFQIFTTERVAANFIVYGILGIALCGVMVPVVWNTLVMRRPLSALGITKKYLTASILAGLVLTVIQYFMTLKNIELPIYRELLPLITMAVAVGFYENVFYRGWVQLRMEEYFGILPAILLSAVLYSLYHIGYGMPSGEMITLFIIGLTFSTIFRLTRNIFILYPLLTPSGALYTLITDGLIIPFEAMYGFASVIFFIIVGLAVITKWAKNKNDSLLSGVRIINDRKVV
jgi:hypothetical protein